MDFLPSFDIEDVIRELVAGGKEFFSVHTGFRPPQVKGGEVISLGPFESHVDRESLITFIAISKDAELDEGEIVIVFPVVLIRSATEERLALGSRIVKDNLPGFGIYIGELLESGPIDWSGCILWDPVLDKWFQVEVVFLVVILLVFGFGIFGDFSMDVDNIVIVGDDIEENGLGGVASGGGGVPSEELHASAALLDCSHVAGLGLSLDLGGEGDEQVHLRVLQFAGGGGNSFSPSELISVTVGGLIVRGGFQSDQSLVGLEEGSQADIKSGL